MNEEKSIKRISNQQTWAGYQSGRLQVLTTQVMVESTTYKVSTTLVTTMNMVTAPLNHALGGQAGQDMPQIFGLKSSTSGPWMNTIIHSWRKFSFNLSISPYKFLLFWTFHPLIS